MVNTNLLRTVLKSWIQWQRQLKVIEQALARAIEQAGQNADHFNRCSCRKKLAFESWDLDELDRPTWD